MRKARILIVDDAVVVRRLVTDVLAAEPGFEVVGAAANGRIALAKIPQVNPDLITLDMEMPEMDGLTTLREIRKLYPKLPVIMFSTLTSRGAAATLDALSFGANDYVTKPANVGSIMAGIQSVRSELVPRIRAFCPWCSDGEQAASPAVVAAKPVRAAPRIKVRPEIVAIGVSTGGPNALADLLPRLPADFPLPIVIVQHMPPLFTKHLATRLNSQCKFEVVEAAAGDVLRPGKALIAPGDFHMSLVKRGTQTVVHLDQSPPENSCRPSVDVLFRSVADLYGARTLGLILTGMGQDGLRGCEWIHDRGGRIVVQDEATSIVWGMPGAVSRAGLADAVVPLDRMAPAIEGALAITPPAIDTKILNHVASACV
ncbi:MAG TPA: chemotaxis response regulator protein-glutamate methylesterase [Pirellulales bacterium]|jgi:two-component system chemotaxis response regulator CheB|nr:chemotaxis response regulator protein-glutamate methylesterase [Pirellulales bacterium]